MTNMAPVEQLRAAADIIERTAAAAIQGRWQSLDDGDRLVARQDDDSFRYVVDEPMSDGASAEHIALWGPDTAFLIATLMRETAETLELSGVSDWGDVTEGVAWLAFADAILAQTEATTQAAP